MATASSPFAELGYAVSSVQALRYSSLKLTALACLESEVFMIVTRSSIVSWALLQSSNSLLAVYFLFE